MTTDNDGETKPIQSSDVLKPAEGLEGVRQMNVKSDIETKDVRGSLNKAASDQKGNPLQINVQCNCHVENVGVRWENLRSVDCGGTCEGAAGRPPGAVGTDREESWRRPSVHLVGGSRVKNVYMHMRRRGFKGLRVHYKGGSTIQWARCVAREIESGAVIVVQTGVNNILNTSQSVANIIHQMRQLVKENRDKNSIVITSILPVAGADCINLGMISNVNEKLRKMAAEENVLFVDMDEYFLDGPYVNVGLFRREAEGFIHLNDDGCEVFACAMDAYLARTLGIEFRTRPQRFLRTPRPGNGRN